MGKKRFIDKKKAATFTLLFRDSAEPGVTPGERIFVRTDRGAAHVAGWEDDDPDLRDGEDEDDSFADVEDSHGQDGPRPSGATHVPEEPDEAEDEGNERKARDGSELSLSASLRAPRGSSNRRPGPLPDDVRREILALGLPDDGYDYTRHLRAMGTVRTIGVFVRSEAGPPVPRADVKAYDASMVELPPSQQVSEDNLTDMEVINVVSSQTRELRSAKALDLDIATALENSEGSEWASGDELDDDFVVQANAIDGSDAEDSFQVRIGEGRGEEDSANVVDMVPGEGNGTVKAERLGPVTEEEGSHILKGKMSVKKEKNCRQQVASTFSDESEGWDEEDEDDFGAQEGQRQYTFVKEGTSSKPSRLLDERFENLAMREYDDDDYGEFEDDDPLARGHADISNFDSVLDEFLVQSKDSHTLDEAREQLGRRKSKSAAGTKVESTRPGIEGEAVGTVSTVLGEDKNQREASEGIDDQEGEFQTKSKESKQEGLGEAGIAPVTTDNDDVNDSSEVSEVEIVLTEEEEDEREKWDCESIVSTYSNLDNHPGKIGDPGRKNRVKMQGQIQEIGPLGGRIRLGGKEQLPVDFLPLRSLRQEKKSQRAEKESKIASVPERRKDETKEERKARKELVKEHRKEARVAKKELKMMYRGVGLQAQHGAAHIAPQGLHLQ